MMPQHLTILPQRIGWKQRGHARQSQKTLFTLIEMLVSISIIAILSSLTIPAVRKSMESTRLMLCSNNLKTLGSATIIYESDYQSLMASIYSKIPIMGYHGYNPSYECFYRDYLNSAPSPENATDFSQAMRYYTNPLFQCPSNIRLAGPADAALGRKYNHYRSSYGAYAFSASDQRVSIERATQVLLSSGIAGGSPILWGDRCNVTDAGQNGGPGETNHTFDDKSPKGGNVVHADGHTEWYPFISTTPIEDTFGINGGDIGDHIGLPVNACFPICSGGGKLSTTQPWWQFGSKHLDFY